jgi:hypothetical protein
VRVFSNTRTHAHTHTQTHTHTHTRQALPAGWKQHVSKTPRKRVYYSGPDGVVQWDNPYRPDQVEKEAAVREVAFGQPGLQEEAVSDDSGDGREVRGRVASIEGREGGTHPLQEGLSRMPKQEWNDLCDIDAGDEEGRGGGGQVGEEESGGEGREGREGGEGEGGGEDGDEGMLLVDGYTGGYTDGNAGLINGAAAVAGEEVLVEAQRGQEITPHLLARLRTRSLGPGYTEGGCGAGEGGRGENGTEREGGQRGERERERRERDYVRATALFEGLCASGKASGEHFEVNIFYCYCCGKYIFLRVCARLGRHLASIAR